LLSIHEDAQTFLHAAWLEQAEHNFTRALHYLDHSLHMRPKQLSALLLKANTAAIIEDFDTARIACKKTVGLVDLVVTQACLARLAADPAQQRLALSRLQQWPNQLIDSSLRSWVIETNGILAFELGDYKQAAAAYRQALSLSPSVQLTAAYADVLLAQENAEQVINLINADVTTPALSLRRLLAQQALGSVNDQHMNALDGRFRAWHANGDYRHAREMAMFYLFLKWDRDLAKELAQRNLNMQREAIDQRLARWASLF